MKDTEMPGSFSECISVHGRALWSAGSHLHESGNSNALLTSVQPDSILQIPQTVPKKSIVTKVKTNSKFFESSEIRTRKKSKLSRQA